MGWTAAGLVLATFCCERMVSLRLVAIASNLAFISYGYLAHLWPILGLHLVMLPLNMWRLRGALADGRPARTNEIGREASYQAWQRGQTSFGLGQCRGAAPTVRTASRARRPGL